MIFILEEVKKKKHSEFITRTCESVINTITNLLWFSFTIKFYKTLYNSMRVRFLDSQLNKSKATKNSAEVTLKLSSNVIGNFND